MPRRPPRFKPTTPTPRREGSTARGYGYAWQRLREQFLREHPLCVDCLQGGRTREATEVDHLIPHRGDAALFWDLDNLQPLCKPHHSAKTRRGE